MTGLEALCRAVPLPQAEGLSQLTRANIGAYALKTSPRQRTPQTTPTRRASSAHGHDNPLARPAGRGSFEGHVMQWETWISGAMRVERSSCGRFMVVTPPLPCEHTCLWTFEVDGISEPSTRWFNTPAGARAFAEDYALTMYTRPDSTGDAQRARMRDPNYTPTVGEALSDPSGFVEGMTEELK